MSVNERAALVAQAEAYLEAARDNARHPPPRGTQVAFDEARTSAELSAKALLWRPESSTTPAATRLEARSQGTV